MNKARERVLYIFLGVIICSVWLVIILNLTKVISLYFSTETMNLFSSISEISLYILVCVLILNSFLYYLVKKYNEMYKNITISLVYLLLATTIISVNVMIWVWVLALGLTFLLLVLSVFDLFPPNR